MRAFCLCLCLLPGCAPFPQIAGVDTSQSAQAPFPQLVPIGTVLAAAPQGAPPAATDLNNRIAALQARAAQLRAPVVDAATRARMALGVSL